MDIETVPNRLAKAVTGLVGQGRLAFTTKEERVLGNLKSALAPHTGNGKQKATRVPP